MNESIACSVEGCDRSAKTRGWCHAHHQRVLRLGHPGGPTVREVSRRRAKICMMDGCPLPSDSFGWCKTHYRRWKATGDPGPLVGGTAPPSPCAVDGCDRPAKTRGWCRGHYSRWWAKGDPGAADLRPTRTGCNADGCDRPHSSSGWCELHYRRVRRGVKPGTLYWVKIPTASAGTTYNAAHRQIVAERGAAADHVCQCGAQAKDWAYQHNDPHALSDERGYLYSLRYYDCYEPMCRSCHNALDRDPDERAIRLLT